MDFYLSLFDYFFFIWNERSSGNVCGCRQELWSRSSTFPPLDVSDPVWLGRWQGWTVNWNKKKNAGRQRPSVARQCTSAPAIFPHKKRKTAEAIRLPAALFKFCTNWPKIKFDFDHRNLPAISWWFSFVSSRHTASTQLAQRTEMGPGLQLAKTRKSEQLIGPPATGAPPTELRKMAWLRPAGSVFFFFFYLTCPQKKLQVTSRESGPRTGRKAWSRLGGG